MATYTAIGAGGNWSSAATWGGAGFPGAADTAILNGTSGSVTVDVPSTCLTLTATGYNTNLVMTSTLTMATGGTCTLPSGASGQLTGTGALILNGTNALTTNGKAIPTLTYGTAGTKTITGNSTIATLNVNSATTHNGLYTLTVSNISLMSTLAGTTTVQFGTAGTHSGTSVMSCSVNWSGNGAINVTGSITYTSFDHTSYTGTFTVNTGVMPIVTGTTVLNASATYVSGGTGASMRFAGASGYNMTSNGVQLPYDLSFNTSSIKTLLDNWTVPHTNQFTALTSASTFNGFKFIIKGVFNTAAGVSGTTVFEFQTGANLTGGAGGSSCPFTFNGNVTISGNVSYGGSGVMTYTSGTITTTGSTITFISAATMNCSGITFANIAMGGNATITLSSALVQTGSLSGAYTVTANGYTWTIGGGLPTSGTCGIGTGTTEFILNGTGSVSNASLTVAGKLTINTAGTITLGNFNLGAGAVLKYVAGTISGTSVITCTENISLDLATIPTPPSFTSTASVGVTLLSKLVCNAMNCLGAYFFNFATGAYDVECNALTITSNGSVYILGGQTLKVNTSISMLMGASTVPGLRALSGVMGLNYRGTYANCAIYRANLANINASASVIPIYNWNGNGTNNCTRVYTVSNKDIRGAGYTIINI